MRVRTPLDVIAARDDRRLARVRAVFSRFTAALREEVFAAASSTFVVREQKTAFRVVPADAAARQAPGASTPKARASTPDACAFAARLSPSRRFGSPASFRAAIDGGPLRRRAPRDV